MPPQQWQDPHMDARSGYQVIVPTRDSAGWCAAVFGAYQALGVEPMFFYDIRSSDGTLAILHDLGATVIPVEPRFDRVEAILSQVRCHTDAEWVVRFDDDELPSVALVSWLNRSLHSIEEPIVAFSRRDVQFIDGRLCYARLEDYYFHSVDPTYLDPQWRAFRPRDVEFIDAIHTPGFNVGTSHTAPASAFFVHFDWILRSFEQRRAKLRRYERQSPGAGWGYAHFYLPELHSPGDLRWTPIETIEFDRLARRIAGSSTQ